MYPAWSLVIFLAINIQHDGSSATGGITNVPMPTEAACMNAAKIVAQTRYAITTFCIPVSDNP